jgi:biopolymer transport protein ExbD
MSMTVGAPSEEEQSAMSDINTTPLVDVMLVLLIIFLITIPVITKTVPVVLPKAANIPTQTKPENITIAVDGAGKIYWNNALLADRTQLIERIKLEAVKQPQPEIHIRGDVNAHFDAIGHVLYAVQRGGIVKVGFITEPDRGFRAAGG